MNNCDYFVFGSFDPYYCCPHKKKRRKKRDSDEVERIDYTRTCSVEYYIDGKLFREDK